MEDPPVGTLGDLLRSYRSGPRDSEDILVRWAVPEYDLEAVVTKNKLETVWRQWTAEQRWHLLRAVEQVV